MSRWTVCLQDCEAGIPLDYLQGLDSVYQDLLADMEAQGAKVLRKKWNQFGNVRAVIDEIHQHSRACKWSKCIRDVMEL